METRFEPVSSYFVKVINPALFGRSNQLSYAIFVIRDVKSSILITISKVEPFEVIAGPTVKCLYAGQLYCGVL